MKLTIMSNESVTGEGDFGVRRVHRGEGGTFESNAEYSIVLPEVDKVAIMALAGVELAAIFTNAGVWSPELHLTTIGAIAGLGGYSMLGRNREAAHVSVSRDAEDDESRDA